MRSRLMNQLAEDVRSARDRRSWARAVCRQASHLARQGYAEDAVAAIKVVRDEFGNDLEPEVAAWLILAEGILHFFSDDWDQAFDRIRRAYSIAAALGATAALPTCAGWLAMVEFNQCDFPSMVRHLAESLSLSGPDDHQARARASLTTADAYHYGGSFAAARPWYERARLHATSEGDEATLSALMFNMAAMRSANVRLADAFGDRSPAEAKQASMEAMSALNFDAAIGTRSLSALVPIVRGQLLGVDRKFEDALKALAEIDQEKLGHRLRTLVKLELAWSHANLDPNASARQLFNDLLAEDLGDQESDDAAYIHGRLAQIGDLLDDKIASSRHSEFALIALGKHREVQRQLRELLDSALPQTTSSAQ